MLVFAPTQNFSFHFVKFYIYIYVYIHNLLKMHHIIFVSFYWYLPDKGSLLLKYRDCATPNGFELHAHINISGRISSAIAVIILNELIFT